MISLNHTASEVQVECNRIYSNCRGAAFTRCRTCFRRQSYGDFKPIPNIRAKTSLTCCDGVGEMRQSALTPQNPVAQKLIFPFYFAVSKELLTFAALISLLTLNCIRMKQEKARNCVKSCKMFASVESFSYFCR